MVAVLLVTHGDLAQALMSSAALIMGEAALIESHGLYHGDSVDNLKDTIKEAIIRLSECSQGDGVLILTDLFGGSPSNAAARAMHELQDSVHCECITGVNLPILLEVATSKTFMKLEELKQHALEVGGNSILDLRNQFQL